MAAKHPDSLYNCEICGEEGLTESDMRSHMMVTHIEGAISCPFCDLGDISADEMVYHVNLVHLDFLGETNDNSSLSPDLWDDNCSNFAYNNNLSNNESPQRSQLKLNLNPPKITKTDSSPCSTKSNNITMCPLCNYGNSSPTGLQEHINRQHFDLTSPSFPEFINVDCSGSAFLCPLCNRSVETIPDLELHVNMDHRDILSPMKSAEVTPSDENSNECCPICGKSNFRTSLELATHIEDHFGDGKSPNGMPSTPKTPLIASLEAHNSDHLLALEMEKREREEQRQREQKEFRQLQAQYGMDNQGNFREQSITNMQRAVYAGEMSVADYYNRQMELRNAERDGVDDGNSCTKGLVPKIRAFSLTTSNVERIWLCTTVDHYCCTYGDRGWGCGYRNIQMILSSLIHHTGYNQCIFNGRNSMPSISKMQELIEGAWRMGFDSQGCEQLGGRLFNTRKWIGATEVITFLSFFRVRCKLIDCTQPTGPNGTHPEMFEWIKKYFVKEETFKSPVYLQHHGHSRTIIGIEELKDGSLQLIVFDPSHSKAQMDQFNNTTTNTQAMKLVRRPLSTLKARQYQLVVVEGILSTDKEYQESKVLQSFRIPAEN